MLSVTILHAAADLFRGATPGTGPLRPWPPNPPAAIPDASMDADLQTKLLPVKAKYSNLAVGVIVFDDTSLLPAHFFGWNLDVKCALGSGSKVMILYAAFQLRDDVRKVAAAGFSDAADLRRKLLTAWKNSKAPALVSLAQEIRAPDQAPFLDQIFDLSDPSAIEFKGMANCGVGDLHEDVSTHPAKTALMVALEEAHSHEHSEPPHPAERWLAILTWKFAKRLWLTTRWSDNAAAYSCATEIGLPYIHALMKASGLFTPNGPGMRLWLAAYENAPANLAPQTDPDPPADDPDKQTYSEAATLLRRCLNHAKYRPPEVPAAGFDKVTKQDGTVRTMAALLIALAQEKLINRTVGVDLRIEPSDTMISFLRSIKWVSMPDIAEDTAHPNATKSYVAESLHAWADELGLPMGYARYDDLWSKLGVVIAHVEETGADVHLYTDWAFVSFATPTSPLPKRIGLIVLNYDGPEPDSAASKDCQFVSCVRDLVLTLEGKPMLS